MDIADINKVANRKRMNVDAEKLREKVSRETAKIIKLKVAQDTAYWDLKEKLQQLEGNHERLQQNMVDVQMQHETISGQYQDELRHRPETLNKMSSTRSICDVLEEYCSRLKETLGRCSSDQAALCAAYQRSGEIVQGIKQQASRDEAETRERIAGLERTVQLTTVGREQLVQLFNSSQQQHEEQAQELRGRLRAAEEKRDELMNIGCELTREVDKQKHIVELKDKSIATLQSELKRLMQEFHHQCGEMKNIILKQETDIKESSEANEELKKAVANQEEFTRSVCRQNEDLQEKVSSLEDEGVRAGAEMESLQDKLQDFTITCDTLRRDVATMLETKDSLQKRIEDMQQEFEVTRESLKGEVAALLEIKQGLVKDIDDKNQRLATSEGTIESLTSQLKSLELDNAIQSAVLATTSEESADKSTVIQNLSKSIQEMETAKLALENDLKEARANAEEKIKELTATIEQKQADNTSQGVTINKLMNDVNTDMKIKSELQATIEKLKRELEVERESGKQKEGWFLNQVDELNGTMKEKEQDLSKQMTIILETRAEKEKLQKKISGMQGTIDNIQKELTGRVAPRAFVPADQDDNAVSLTPRHPDKNEFPAQPRGEFAVPSCEPRKEVSMFNIFSDSSVEGETPADANRRFEAIRRGEKLAGARARAPPAPAKRRRAVPQQDRAPAPRPQSPIISLVQMRDDMKVKEKTFFKSKRPENKLKRFKKLDDDLN